MLFARKAIHLRLGQSSERKAIRHLKKSGLTFVKQNYSCKAGEIDAIFLDGMTLVAVEVRSRSYSERQVANSSTELKASHSINQAKKQRIRKSLDHFVRKNPEHRFRPRRFDIVSIEIIRYRPSLSSPLLQGLKSLHLLFKSTRPGSYHLDWFQGAF